MNKCPKCFSRDIKIANYLGVKTVKCRDCGWDETTVYEVYSQQKTSQKAKGRYSPYKTGGKQRTRKK